MRSFTRLLGLVIGTLLVSPLSGRADTGSFQVTVDGVPHTISNQVFGDQHINDLRDPVRFRFPEGSYVAMEVLDGAEPRIIQKVSVEMPPTARLPEGADLDLPLTERQPGDTGVDFFLRMGYTDAYIGTFEFVIKLTTGDKIRITPFPVTLQRLPDVQNIQFLDDTTRPVITWASMPGAQRYGVRVYDPDTGLAVFRTFGFPAAPGDVQTLDLKAPPAGMSFPIGWTGMEIGKRYVVRIEGRLRGSNPVTQFVTLPFPKGGSLPAPPAGQGIITRSNRWVEYTPLVLAP